LRSNRSEAFCFQPELVEAPGTAPGSDELIPTSVYRHSRTNPALLI